MADFSTFELAEVRDRPAVIYKLGDGVIPEIAEAFGHQLTVEPDVNNLGQLVGTVGAAKTLQDNIESVQAVLGTNQDGFNIAADWMEHRAHIQDALDRSLWTPELATPDDVAGTIVSGGVRNWMMRASQLLEARVADGRAAGRFFFPVGQREMDKPTEIVTEDVIAYRDAHGGQLPTEAIYAREIIAPRLEAAGYQVEVDEVDSQRGPDIALEFMQAHPELLEGKLAFARVANAGLQLAIEMRQAARTVRPDFDSDASNPQVFVLTDTVPVARDEQQFKDARFQNPYSALRSIPLTAKMLLQSVQ